MFFILTLLVIANHAYAKNKYPPVEAKPAQPFEWKAQIDGGSTVYCAQQRQSGKENFVYFTSSTCQKVWYSSIFGQIYTMYKGQMFCVTLPPSVFDNKTSWDYIALFPCSLNNDDQKLYWSDDQQTFFSQETVNSQHLPVKVWKDYLYFANYLSALYGITFSKSETSFKYMQSSAKNLTVMLQMPKYIFRRDRFNAYYNFNKENKNLFFYNYDVTSITCVSGEKPQPKSVVLATHENLECDANSTKWNLSPSNKHYTIPFTSKQTAMFHFISDNGNFLGRKKDSADYYIIHQDIAFTSQIQNDYQIDFKLDANARRLLKIESYNATVSGAWCPFVRPSKPPQKMIKSRIPRQSPTPPPPTTSQLSSAWVKRLWQIARTGDDDLDIWSNCGLCFMQAIEMVAELIIFGYAPTFDDSRGHFFSVTGPQQNPDGSWSSIPLDFATQRPQAAHQLTMMTGNTHYSATHGGFDRFQAEIFNAVSYLFPERTIDPRLDYRVPGEVGEYGLATAFFSNLHDGEIALVSITAEETNSTTGLTDFSGHTFVIFREDGPSGDYVNFLQTNIPEDTSLNEYLAITGPYPYTHEGIRDIVELLSSARLNANSPNYTSRFLQGTIFTISRVTDSSSDDSSDSDDGFEDEQATARSHQVPALSYAGCNDLVSPYVVTGAVGGHTDATNYCLDAAGAPILCTDTDEQTDEVRGLGAVTPTPGSPDLPGSSHFHWYAKGKDEFRRSLTKSTDTLLYNMLEPQFTGEQLYTGQFNGEQWGFTTNRDGSINISSEDSGKCLFPLGNEDGAFIGVKPCKLVTTSWQLSSPSENGQVMISTSPTPFSPQSLCITTPSANQAYRLYPCDPHNQTQYFTLNKINPVLISSKANNFYLQSRKDKTSLKSLVYFAKNGAKTNKQWEIMANYYQDAFMLKNVSTDLCLSAVEIPQPPQYKSITMTPCDHYQFLQAWRVHMREGEFVQLKNAGIASKCLEQENKNNQENQAQLKICQDTPWQKFKVIETITEQTQSSSKTFPIIGVKIPDKPNCKTVF